MKIDISQVKLVSAEKNNENHKKGVWNVFNENIEFFHLTKNPISYEEHKKWWEIVFNTEFIFVILYRTIICGYIRLTKVSTNTKNNHEISIALSKKYQNSGIGSYAYDIFEKEITNKGISKIIANTDIRNKKGQKFFEKKKYLKTTIKYFKKLNIKDSINP